MKKVIITACPLCGNTHVKKSMTCTDHFASGESFDLYMCDSCGFLFTQGVPEESEIGRYYETSEYISHSDTRKGAMNTVYHYVRSYMLQRKARLVQSASHRKGGRLLDIGTGTGYFAHTMVQKGWQVEAVEKSAQARAFAQQHFALAVKPETELETFAPKSFDVVTLWHVLEHLEHLDHTWQRLYELMDEGGTLIVAVPNHTSFDAHLYGSQWAAYDVPRHLWHFSPDTIRQYAQKHGFSLAEEHPMPFDAFYVSMLSERGQKHSAAFLRGMWSGTRAWMASLGNKEKSSSMIYVFQKR